MVLQVWTVIKNKEFGGPFPTFLEQDPDNIDSHRADPQCPIDRPPQSVQRMILQQSQNANVFATSFAAGFHFKPTSKDVQPFGQFPVFERFAEVERIRLSFQ